MGGNPFFRRFSPRRFYPFLIVFTCLAYCYAALRTVTLHPNKKHSIMIENEFLNRVELRGRVGHDPKIFSVGDAQVARFSLATNEAYRGRGGELREEVTWHNVSAWAGRNVMDFKDIRKGTFVSLVGRLRSSKYTGNDGSERNMVEVVAGRLEPYVPAVRE